VTAAGPTRRLALTAATLTLPAAALARPRTGEGRPPPGPGRLLPGARAVDDLDARAIVSRATEVAGGETWRRPRSLLLRGYGVFHQPDATSRVHDRHTMWRVYPAWKGDAHRADGKVRIESWQGTTLRSFTAFDGTRTYGLEGPLPPSDADRQWAENFGFGVIRFALDEGYTLTRRPDDLVEGSVVHVIEVADPAGGKTWFSIAHGSFHILKVAFATPRGWHERFYSHFYRKPGVSWLQPGRVRLLYNGVKQNEIVWPDFTLNEAMDDRLFDTPPKL
jgi:hypothetical protein